jgi:hypothetical protein
MAEDFVSLVTSKAWRERLASLLLGRLSSAELEKFGEDGLLARWWVNGDSYAGVEYYVSKNRPVPASIGKAIMEEHQRPKKRGRNARREEQAEQAAHDIACFLATEYLMETEGLKLSPACERVGTLMIGSRRSRQAVADARKRGKCLAQRT